MRSTREETAAYGTVFSGGEGGRNLVAEGPGARIFAGIAERDARAANGVDRDVATALVNDGAGAAVVDALGLGGGGTPCGAPDARGGWCRSHAGLCARRSSSSA